MSRLDYTDVWIGWLQCLLVHFIVIVELRFTSLHRGEGRREQENVRGYIAG